jgi:hypothetical protein
MTLKGKPENEVDVTADPPRRPYRAPRLRHLGSVRELTLGGSKGPSEDGGSFMNSATMKKM